MIWWVWPPDVALTCFHTGAIASPGLDDSRLEHLLNLAEVLRPMERAVQRPQPLIGCWYSSQATVRKDGELQ